MVSAMQKELVSRSLEWNEPIETIYFGGGTPSILDTKDIAALLETIYKNFKVITDPELTLEANPDDLTKSKIDDLWSVDINRLSIGVQSFFEDDLKLMNRAHGADDSRQALDCARSVFENISIDLIYGIPNATMAQWQKNIQLALDYDLRHISAYALTVEPKTAFANFIQKGIMSDVNDDHAKEQFDELIAQLEMNGFEHYELSNFAQSGWYSKNNTAYWQGKSYLGIGPSAHSFDGNCRSWNISNNRKYIDNIANGLAVSEEEHLSKIDQYNEYIMTGLRTTWGVNLSDIEHRFGPMYKKYLLDQSKKFIEEQLLFLDDTIIKVSRKGRFLSDGIAADLFMLNLK